MFKQALDWLQSKWPQPRDTEAGEERRRLDYLVQRAFGTADGRELLNVMLSETYFTISYVPGGRCCDNAFNEGRRAVVHELLEALDRAEKNKYGRRDNDRDEQ